MENRKPMPRCFCLSMLALPLALMLALVVAPVVALTFAPVPAHAQDTAATVETVPYAAADPAACGISFVAHDLDHTTTTSDGVVRMFEANGSGLAAGDLDGDGDLDLLLGNHDGPDTLLWNEGGLTFRKQEFSGGKTRDVKLVDVDADGRLDVVLTRNTGAINYYPTTWATANSSARPSPAWLRQPMWLTGPISTATATWTW